MADTKIEWADSVWNPVTGCTKISPGCANCYAERMAKRLAGRCGYLEQDPFKVTLHSDRLGQPLNWKKPKRIFVCSMADLFHEDVPDEFIARMWWVMGQCVGYLDPSRYRGHTFMILTKRPERMKKWLKGWADQKTRKRWIESFGEVYDWMNGPRYWPNVFDNVWLGVTAENQEQADKRIPVLLQTPAAVRFVSCEPLLGSVDLTNLHYERLTSIDALNGLHGFPKPHAEGPKLDWVIVGGETGPGTRPMHPDWVRNLRDQCQAAGVAYFFKQWGEFAPVDGGVYPGDICISPDGTRMVAGKDYVCFANESEGAHMRRVGKKKAGRLLDGQFYDGMPGR